MTQSEFELRAPTPAERPRLAEVLAREWGSPKIVSRGRLHDASVAPAIGAFRGDQLVGLATYELSGPECEILTLNAFEAGQGIGAALLDAVTQAAKAADCKRLWLITSDDNRTAIRFYERRGLRLVAVHHGAMDEARRLKPEIPEFAPDGTRISDGLEFELDLSR